MALLPLLFSNWLDELDRPHHIRDQHFGLGLHPEHLCVQSRPSLVNRSMRGPYANYYRPWAELLCRGEDSGLSTVKSDKDKFEVALDVQQFSPSEINVKVVDKYIIVEGNHEEKQDEHGWISRKFTRKYLIPEQCDLEKIESKLSSDGILSISLPRKASKVEGERVISIRHTGAPAIREKAGSQEEKPEEEK